MSAPPAVVLGFGALAVAGLMWVGAASVSQPDRAPSPRAAAAEAPAGGRALSSELGVIDPLRGAPTFLGDSAAAPPAPAAPAAAPVSKAPSGAAAPRGRRVRAPAPSSAETGCAAAARQISGLRAPFARGQERPGAEADGVLARAAALAAPCPDLVVEVRGFADDHADPIQNLDLAERRALEAAGRLERHGAAAGQLVRSASGDPSPRAGWRGVVLRAGARGAR